MNKYEKPNPTPTSFPVARTDPSKSPPESGLVSGYPERAVLAYQALKTNFRQERAQAGSGEHPDPAK